MKAYELGSEVRANKDDVEIFGNISEIQQELQYEIKLKDGSLRTVDHGMIYQVKTPSRIKGYIAGTNDWGAEYNMLLPDGIMCKDCVHNARCASLFGGKETNTSCQFHPNRFHLNI